MLKTLQNCEDWPTTSERKRAFARLAAKVGGSITPLDPDVTARHLG